MSSVFRLAALAVLAAISACAAQLGGGAAQQRACPALQNVDLAELRRLADPVHNAGVEGFDAWVRDQTSRTPMPPEAEAAATRIRVGVPATGMWAIENRVTVWREGDAWFIARRDMDLRAPPPVPQSPGVDVAPAPLTLEQRFPVVRGQLSPEQGRALDAMLADPCLWLEPNRVTSRVPRVRGDDWICVADSSSWAGEVVQPGQPPRLIGIACESDLLTSRLLQYVSRLTPVAN